MPNYMTTSAAGGNYANPIPQDRLVVTVVRFNGVDYYPDEDGLVSFEGATVEQGALADTAVQAGANVGIGYNIFAGKVGTELRFKSIQAGANVTITQDGEVVTIASADAIPQVQPDWNATSGLGSIKNKPDLSPLDTALQGASNVGTGQGLFKQVVAKLAQFRSIKAGSNVTIALVDDDLVISSAGSSGPAGESNTASSAGTGSSIVLPKNGVDLPFRSFLAGVGLSWVSAADTLQIKLAAVLEGISALSVPAGQLIYTTAANTFNYAPLTVFGRLLVAAADAPAVRTLLGLGTAATREATTGPLDTTSERLWRTNDLVKTTGALDNTPGRIVRVGDFGRNGGGSLHLGTSGDWNTVVVPGLYDNLSGFPWTNEPPAAYPFVDVMGFDASGNYVRQVAYSGTTTDMATRFYFPGQWSPWAKFWTSANQLGLGTTPASARSALELLPVQTTAFTNPSDIYRLARVGSFGFGGPAQSVDAITDIEYGASRIFRVNGNVGATGFELYSPILHLSGADTWAQLQIGYGNGKAVISWGYTSTRYGSAELWTSANFNPATKLNAYGGTLASNMVYLANAGDPGAVLAYAGALEIRETGLLTATQGASEWVRPAISFHWAGWNVRRLSMDANADLYWGAYPILTEATRAPKVITVASNRLFNLGDVNNYLRVSSGYIEMPSDPSYPVAIGTEITLRNSGSVNMAIGAWGGVLIHAPSGGTLSLAPRMTAVLKKVAYNEWDLIGQTVSA